MVKALRVPHSRACSHRSVGHVKPVCIALEDPARSDSPTKFAVTPCPQCDRTIGGGGRPRRSRNRRYGRRTCPSATALSRDRALWVDSPELRPAGRASRSTRGLFGGSLRYVSPGGGGGRVPHGPDPRRLRSPPIGVDARGFMPPIRREHVRRVARRRDAAEKVRPAVRCGVPGPFEVMMPVADGRRRRSRGMRVFCVWEAEGDIGRGRFRQVRTATRTFNDGPRRRGDPKAAEAFYWRGSSAGRSSTFRREVRECSGVRRPPRGSTREGGES